MPGFREPFIKFILAACADHRKKMLKTQAAQWLQAGFLAGLMAILFPSNLSLAFTSPKTSDAPETLSVGGQELRFKDLKNPFRQDSNNLKNYIKEGGITYFKNCFLCHGDLMDGRGLFGDRFFPHPADFNQAIAENKSESYFFWRILKGAQGLPREFHPGESAMPAWEGTLAEDEIWKVILFIFDNVKNPVVPDPPAEPSVERGQLVYKEKCVYCHAENGSGKGVSAFYSSPRPRNFIKGQYKFRTTPFGKIPTDDDLYKMLVRGMPGTTMPSWKHFPEVDLKSLVLYLKTFSKKFAKFKKKGKTHKLIQIESPPPFDDQSLERGKKFFAATCSGCHGLQGRSDGESTKRNVDIGSDAIRPRNLTQPWTFRRGKSPQQLFLTIRTGLSTTAMPRHSKRIFKDRDVWDIVHYVATLSKNNSRNVARKIKAVKTTGVLPLNPDDAAWADAPAFNVPLAGQIIQAEKAFYPTIDDVKVQALHNGEELAIKLTWDDPTFDPILKTVTDVQESPVPPLPPQFQMEPEESEQVPEEPKPQKYPDAIALQFPAAASADGSLPYFLNGDESHPVNLWQWRSHPNRVSELTAQGMAHITEHPESSQQVQSKVIFRYGQYQLVMKRKLSTEDKENDIQFEAGKTIPFAINAWDGNMKETGTRKSISSWFQMTLE